MRGFQVGFGIILVVAVAAAGAAQSAPDADALEQRATELFASGNNPDAIAALEQVRALRHAAGQQALEARALWRLGTAYRGAGRSVDAVRVTQDAYRLARAASDDAIAAEAISQLHQLNARPPEFPDAAHALEEALRLAHSANQPRTLARILDTRARWLGDIGQGDAAVASASEGIDYAAAAGDNALLAGLFAIRSAFVSRNGLLGDALADALRAREAAAKVGPRAEVTALFSLAQANSHLSNFEEAARLWTDVIDRYRAIGPPIGVALGLDARCHVYGESGRDEQALADVRDALAAFAALNQRPSSALYSRAALSSVRLGRDGDARRWLAEAAARVDAAPEFEQFQTRTQMAMAYLALGDVAAARSTYTQILEIGRKRGSPEDEWKGQLGLGRAALAAHDPAAAIPHLQQAAAIVEQLRTTVPAQELRAAYLSRRVEAHEWLVAALMMQSGSASDRYVEEAFNVAERARVRALADLLAEGHARRRSGTPAAPPQARTRTAIAAELGPRELLLEYLVGEQRGYGWALTRDNFVGFPLPEPAALAESVQRVLDYIDHNDGEGLHRVGPDLASALLGPVSDHLDQFDRIIVVADGPLQRLPFAALPMPGDSGLYLAHRAAISTVGSGSLLTLLQRDEAGGGNSVLALASSGDARGPAGAARSDRAPLLDAAGEAHDALRVLGAPAGSRAVPDASELEVKNSELADYQLIHVAAHSLIDESMPRNSAILLRPGGGEDGALRAAEISQMPLHCDLVVLAACRTQFGRVLRGEGLLSLARSFMEAGARSVVASLWDVGDHDTRVLMRSFYAGIAAGLAPDLALRIAQLQMIRAGGSLASPKAWAAFQVAGEARHPVWQPHGTSPLGITVTVAALASLALLLRT